MDFIELNSDVATYPARFSEVVKRTRDLPLPSKDSHIAGTYEPQDNRDDNALRAEFAALAVKAYARRTGVLDEEPELAIKDLLGDLMHLCDALGLNFEGLVESGRYHYDCEVRGVF